MGQAPREAPWQARARLQAGCWTLGLLCKTRLALLGFVVSQRLDRRWNRTPAIFGERFARQNDVVIPAFGRSARTSIAAAMVKTTRIAFALWRRVFRRRQIAPARSVVASATIAASAAPASPAASPPSTPPTVASAIPATVLTRAAIVSEARRIIPRGIVRGSKILRSRGVGIRLALLDLGNFRLTAGFFAARGLKRIVWLRGAIGLWGTELCAPFLLLGTCAVLRLFYRVHRFVHTCRRQRFPR